jgi:hypothetical protein
MATSSGMEKLVEVIDDLLEAIGRPASKEDIAALESKMLEMLDGMERIDYLTNIIAVPPAHAAGVSTG